MDSKSKELRDSPDSEIANNDFIFNFDLKPHSVAIIVRPDSVADIGGPQGSGRDFKARELRGRHLGFRGPTHRT